MLFRSAQGWLKIYIDDLIITTEDNETDYTYKVIHVLKKLQEHDLYLKPEKCHFHKKEIEYLGVIIRNGSVKMDPVVRTSSCTGENVWQGPRGQEDWEERKIEFWEKMRYYIFFFFLSVHVYGFYMSANNVCES